MSKEKKRRGHPIYGAFFLSLVATLFLWVYSKIRIPFLLEKHYTIELVEIQEGKKRDYNLADMYHAMQRIGIRFPLIVLCQMYHEGTQAGNRGNLSKIAEGNKNPLGMKVNSRGYAINYPRDKNCKDYLPCIDCTHACYNTWGDALKDYAEWQSQRLSAYERHYGRKVTTQEDYLNFLDDLVIGNKAGYRYAEDPKYTNTLRRVWIPKVSRALKYYQKDLVP